MPTREADPAQLDEMLLTDPERCPGFLESIVWVDTAVLMLLKSGQKPPTR